MDGKYMVVRLCKPKVPDIVFLQILFLLTEIWNKFG